MMIIMVTAFSEEVVAAVADVAADVAVNRRFEQITLNVLKIY